MKETRVLPAFAWRIPCAIHRVPWSGARLRGAYLRPMFWATLVAADCDGAGLGVVVGRFAPAINRLVAGLPAGNFLSGLSFELRVFALVTAWAVRRAPGGAKLGSAGLQTVTTAFGDSGAPGEFFARSLVGGVAGLGVLAAINAGLAWGDPKGAGGEK